MICGRKINLKFEVFEKIFTIYDVISNVMSQNESFLGWFLQILKVLSMKNEKSPNLRTARTVVDLTDCGIMGIDKMELSLSQMRPTRTQSPTNRSSCLVLMETRQRSRQKLWLSACLTWMRLLRNAGYSDVYMCNYRGKCNTPLLTPRLSFPIGEYNDLSAVVTHVSEKFPDIDRFF